MDSANDRRHRRRPHLIRGPGWLWPVLALLAPIFHGCSSDKPLERVSNQPPEIQSVTAAPDTVPAGGVVELFCDVTDPESEQLEFEWSSGVGSFLGTLLNRAEVRWRAPTVEGSVRISVLVKDSENQVQGSVDVFVLGETGDVSGTVRDQVTEEPLAGVLVELGTRSTTTGADGTFLIETLALGNYPVKATLDGYNDFEITFEVKEGANTLDILMVALTSVGRVAGTITNSVGQPVSEATCLIDDQETSSDEVGGFEFETVPLGSHLLRVVKPGYILFSTPVMVDTIDAIIDVSLDADQLPPPTGLTAEKSGLTITVSWNRPPDETLVGYQIFQRVDEGATEAIGGDPRPPEQTSIQFQGEEHSRYQYRIAAINVDGDEGPISPVSNIVVLTPLSPLVAIPSGSVVMGDTPAGWPVEDPWGDETHPGNPVSVPAFEIEPTEVTNLQYRAFLYEALSTGAVELQDGVAYSGGNLLLNANASKIRWEEGLGQDIFTITQGFENHPVVGVTWYGARAYADHTGRRLPTEAEWERAARGVSTEVGTYPGSEIGYGTKYPWGNDDPGPTRANYEGNVGTTLPAESLPEGAARHWGDPIYHLAGNVWEWCADWKAAYQDPHQPPAEGTLKVTRGGGWQNQADWLRNGARFSFSPGEPATTSLGFRCARTP